MYGGKVTLYDILGISRDAKRDEIVRAYKRLIHEMQQEKSMPEPGAEARVHEAYEVLTDSHRRAFYDASLRKPRFLGEVAAKARNPRWIGGLGAGLVALVAALWFSQRGPSGPPPLPREEIVAAISRSVGGVQAIEMSGRTTPVAAAFAVEGAQWVTACPVLPSGAQLVVRLGTRAAPAQVSVADEVLGVCKLAVAGAGSWPLAVTTLEPRNGDRIYVARTTASGDVTVSDGVVKKGVPGEHGRSIELSVAVAPSEAGSPVLDAQGRVIGIAAPPNLAWPARWIADARARPRATGK